MTFLGNPCQCGWAYTEISETVRVCEKCCRELHYKDGYWVQFGEGWRSRGTSDLP